MKYHLLSNEQLIKIVLCGLLLFGAGVTSDLMAQSSDSRPRPNTTVKTPVGTVPAASPVGGATGAGVGTGTGTGTGSASGSGIGSPSGSVTASPTGNAAGQANGSGAGTANGGGTGTSAGSGSGTGAGIGSGTGNGTGTAVGSTTTTTSSERTYIKELNGRCYYVTPQGTKQFVARSNCSLYR